MSRLRHSSDDQAVSPVIAVILMVAITVVLGATVYVWVSGFGGQSSEPASSVSFTKLKSGYYSTFTVSSATSGLRWSDLTFAPEGLSAYDVILANGGSSARTTRYTPTSNDPVLAGQTFYIVNGATSAASGGSLMVLDSAANAVISSVSGISMDAATSATPTTAGTTIARVTGSAGAYGASSSVRITFDKPIQPDSLTLGTSVTISANDFTGVTLAVTSPTTAVLTFSGTSTIDGTETLTFTTTVKDVTGAAVTQFTRAFGGV